VLLLRGGFFENLYIAPLLLGEEFYPQRIWHASPEGEPRAAEEYAKRYGRLWDEEPGALPFLREVWNDSLIRAELRNFINLSKNLLNTGSDAEFADLLREREMFLNPERIKRTQSEILSRLTAAKLRLPVARPRLGLVLLASRSPGESVEFYRKLLEVEPRTTRTFAGGYAEFDFGGLRLSIHGQDRVAVEDPYRLGTAPASLGWGAIFVFVVSDFDRYYRNAVDAGLEILDVDLTSQGKRSFVVKDPSGYLLEMTEEEPRGHEAP
jgi:catechol 2,3-dioxygenase-like lactoylglutathione lyase family enzyme